MASEGLKSNGVGRVRAGFLRARPVGCVIGAVRAAPLVAARSPAVAIARPGTIAARRTFEAPLTHSEFKSIAARAGWAIKAAPSDSWTGRTVAGWSRPTTVDELGQLGELAPAEHVVAIGVEPAEQCAEVALARAAHGADRAARPIPTPRPVRIAARPIRITTGSLGITTRIAVSLLSVARLLPAPWLGVRTTLSVGRVSAALFKQVAHFLAKSIETVAHLVPHGLAFFSTQPAIAIFIECPQNALPGRPTRTIAFATLFWRLREGGLS